MGRIRGGAPELSSAALELGPAGFDTPGPAGGVWAPGGLSRRILTTASLLPRPEPGHPLSDAPSTPALRA